MYSIEVHNSGKLFSSIKKCPAYNETNTNVKSVLQNNERECHKRTDSCQGDRNNYEARGIKQASFLLDNHPARSYLAGSLSRRDDHSCPNIIPARTFSCLNILPDKHSCRINIPAGSTFLPDKHSCPNIIPAKLPA